VTVGLVPFASIGFLITGSAYLMANLFPLFATEYVGLSPAAVGAVYALGAVLALSGPLWGWLADRFNHHLVLSFHSAANVGSSVLYLVAPNFGGVAAGKALDDAGKTAFRPAWGALMANVAHQDRARRARVMAWLSMGEDAGEVAGPHDRRTGVVGVGSPHSPPLPDPGGGRRRDRDVHHDASLRNAAADHRKVVG
jgi:MFS family permease